MLDRLVERQSVFQRVHQITCHEDAFFFPTFSMLRFRPFKFENSSV